MDNQFKKTFITILIVCILVSSVFGAISGFWFGLMANNYNGQFSSLFSKKTGVEQVFDNKKIIQVEEDSATVSVVEKVSPAVVSVIVTKDLPVLERYYSDPFGGDEFFRRFFGDDFGGFFSTPQYRQKGTEQREIGGGTGFIISNDGYIVTNKHVVSDEEADYTVLLNDENKYEAKVLARDGVTDLAILKIEGDNFPTVELGDSSNLRVGQTVIAIGNSLGEFKNTVSKGVISGLSRTIVAGGAGFGSEELMGVIQTDASINPGNSGGPLLNIAGQVIGINTAMASGAENIGFAIPINEVKNTIDNVQENGRLVRPWLGVRYAPINEEIAEANKLDVDYGAIIVRGDNRTDLAVIPGSPADKAGLQENDIILEVNEQKIDNKHPLNKEVSKYKPGEEVSLKILHKGEEKDVKVKLEEMNNN
jgi:serine protease Do